MPRKKSKLAEKSTRMPNILQHRHETLISQYCNDMEQIQSESARSHRFSLLLQQLFGVQTGFIEDYVTGIEKFLKTRQKDRVLKGRVDELFGNLVIEFERILDDEHLQEAQDQLKKYIAILWSLENPDLRTPYIAIATDGIRFSVFSPVLKDPLQQSLDPDFVELKLIDEIDLNRLKPLSDFYFWLDRYFLRNETLPPKSENIVKDFGLTSHAFIETYQALYYLWTEVKNLPNFQVIYTAWEKYLSIVYGSPQANEPLFLRHTYLATLAKLMVWVRLTQPSFQPDEKQLHEVLEGRFFSRVGLENFLEEDFFSWIARPEIKNKGIALAYRLLSLLRKYYLRGLSEDVLKSLYQELVDPETRHDLGEYYTPDWLAERIIANLLEKNPSASVLDPACGSGTFLYQTIRLKRYFLQDSLETLQHILSHVVGVDIHPLAVIVSKANYILALGDLLQKRKGRISVPVYMANTLKLPERSESVLWMQMPAYKVDLNGVPVYLPEFLIQNPSLYDRAVDASREFASEMAEEPSMDKRGFLNYLRTHHPELAQDELLSDALFHIAETLHRFIRAKRDTIWAFVLKNSYRPLFLIEKFDLVVGNPPWLSYRYVEQPEEQKFLKNLITKEYKLLSGRVELITHMELGTLFLLRSADLYLKPGGTIAFVLPRSVFSADQHDRLRKRNFEKVPLNWLEVWDLEHVEPLFNVPACVVFARKNSSDFSFRGVKGVVYRGRLPRKNATLSEAQEHLFITSTLFQIHLRGKRSFWAPGERSKSNQISPYKRLFHEGATIVPRKLWFVEIQPSRLGMNFSIPPLRTDQSVGAQKPYKNLKIQGQIENQFLYATLLSGDIFPFGHRPFRLVVLPIEPVGDRYRLIRSSEAKSRGFIHLAKWLETAQSEWEKRRGQKAEKMDIYERLDRYRGLTRQNPQAKYRVVYPDVNRVMAACIVKTNNRVLIPVRDDYGELLVPVQNIVIDGSNYYMETDSIEEALYLVAFLNSTVIDNALEGLRNRTQKNQPHVHKKVFDVATIPFFNPQNRDHQMLVDLSKISEKTVQMWLASKDLNKTKDISVLRREVRDLLQEELKEIDRIVEKLLTEQQK